PSLHPGETLVLHVATDSPRFRVEFFRQGARLERRGGLPARTLPGRPLPEGPPDRDWGWPGYRWTIPADWPSGAPRTAPWPRARRWSSCRARSRCRRRRSRPASRHRRQQQGRRQRISGGGPASGRRALWEAQIGRKAPYAKPLKGFGGAGVLEIIDNFDSNAFRTV